MDQGPPYIHIRLGRDRSVTVRGSTSVRLGHRIERPGDREPDGIFAGWRWENGRLVLTRDRYGLYPMYYFERPGQFGLSPSIPQLLQLGAPTGLDDVAMAVFLRQGFFLGEDTPFRGIRAVPPCTSFEWRAEGLSVSPRQPIFSGPTRLSREGAVEAYIELFRAAMRRRLPPAEGAILPLSGGRDSRHILLELCAAGAPPRLCVTQYGHPRTSADDVEVARRVAGALDLPHEVLERSPFRLEEERRHNLVTSFCARNHGWFLSLGDWLRGRTGVTYDGIGGDVLSTRIPVSPQKVLLFEQGRYRRLAELLVKKSVERGLRRVLTAEAYARFSREKAVERLAEEHCRFCGAPNPIPLFNFYNRTRRNVALSPYAVLAGIRTVYSPYLDHDLYDFLTSLPTAMILEGLDFHEEVIRRAFPELASIPFAGAHSPGDGLPRAAAPERNGLAVHELRRFAFHERPSRFVRSSWLRSRLLRSLVTPSYGVERYAALPVYLLQLERLQGEQAPERSATPSFRAQSVRTAT